MEYLMEWNIHSKCQQSMQKPFGWSTALNLKVGNLINTCKLGGVMYSYIQPCQTALSIAHLVHLTMSEGCSVAGQWEVSSCFPLAVYSQILLAKVSQGSSPALGHPNYMLLDILTIIIFNIVNLHLVQWEIFLLGRVSHFLSTFP